MGLRSLLRTTATLATATVVAALLTAPSATARPCADCEDPDLPDDPGVPCSTIAASSEPSITSPVSPSQARVGATVTARTGVWNSNTKAMTAHWYVGNAAVAGANHSWTSNVDNRTVTYVITPADLGKPVRLRVRGIGTHSACVHDEYSDDTAAVTHGPAPVASTAPAITGEARVGETLTVSSGTWNPTPESFTYTWRRHGGEDDGAHRGTGATYTLRADDLGKHLRVEVTTTLSGHLSATAEPTTAVVSTGDTLVANVAPAVTGDPVYGETLTATDGTWTPAATTIEREWLRDGQPIAGAEGTTYELGLDDVGATIALRVTAHADGHASGTSTVDVGAVTRAAAPTWSGKKVRLKGKNKVKKKVKVALGAKAIRKAATAPDATLAYQWLRNGKVIKASTKKAHKIVKADRRKKLKARITLTRPGHHPLVITTKAVKIRNNGKKIR